MAMKRWIVRHLERGCEYFHFITFHRPWLWLPIHNRWCLLARWSDELDQRWGTGVWEKLS